MLRYDAYDVATGTGLIGFTTDVPVACQGRSEPSRVGARQGDVVGEHVVTYSTIGETVTITHRAHSRDAFASGAIRAAKFLAGREPGRYTMAEVLAL